jgi:hypothetical protein
VGVRVGWGLVDRGCFLSLQASHRGNGHSTGDTTRITCPYRAHHQKQRARAIAFLARRARALARRGVGVVLGRGAANRRGGVLGRVPVELAGYELREGGGGGGGGGGWEGGAGLAGIFPACARS